MPPSAIFVSIVLPVVLVVFCGYVLERTLAVDVKSVSRVALYAFSPCLVFSSLLNSSLAGRDLFTVWGFVLSAIACMWLLGSLVARGLGLSQRQRGAFLLSTMFSNTGNFGLPVLLYAFGQPGLELGLLYFVASSFVTNTLGIFVASQTSAGVRGALRTMLRMPVVYAVVLALLFNRMGVGVPEWLSKPITLLGAAAVPTMELVLGMQLARTSLGRELRLTVIASVLALMASAGVAFGVAALWGLQGLTRQVCILETATPTAVTSTVLATEFDADPGFVTGVVFLTTLASVVTVTALLALLL